MNLKFYWKEKIAAALTVSAELASRRYFNNPLIYVDKMANDVCRNIYFNTYTHTHTHTHTHTRTPHTTHTYTDVYTCTLKIECTYTSRLWNSGYRASKLLKQWKLPFLPFDNDNYKLLYNETLDYFVQSIIIEQKNFSLFLVKTYKL